MRIGSYLSYLTIIKRFTYAQELLIKGGIRERAALMKSILQNDIIPTWMREGLFNMIQMTYHIKTNGRYMSMCRAKKRYSIIHK